MPAPVGFPIPPGRVQQHLPRWDPSWHTLGSEEEEGGGSQTLNQRKQGAAEQRGRTCFLAAAQVQAERCENLRDPWGGVQLCPNAATRMGVCVAL